METVIAHENGQLGVLGIFFGWILENFWLTLWNLVDKRFCFKCDGCGEKFHSADYRRTGMKSAATANSAGGEA